MEGALASKDPIHRIRTLLFTAVAMVLVLTLVGLKVDVEVLGRHIKRNSVLVCCVVVPKLPKGIRRHPILGKEQRIQDFTDLGEKGNFFMPSHSEQEKPRF